jgi:hypothetical protein
VRIENEEEIASIRERMTAAGFDVEAISRLAAQKL